MVLMQSEGRGIPKAAIFPFEWPAEQQSPIDIRVALDCSDNSPNLIAQIGGMEQLFLQKLFHPPNLRDKVRRVVRAIERNPYINRTLLLCRPFKGENRCFWYPPPFGLHQYHSRCI